MIAEAKVSEMLGIPRRELRELRSSQMQEGVHYELRGHLKEVLLTDRGLELLNQNGVEATAELPPTPPRRKVRVKFCPFNLPRIKNPKVMIGEIDGREVTMRCRTNVNFVPGMEVECDFSEGLYFVRRHPRFRGKW